MPDADLALAGFVPGRHVQGDPLTTAQDLDRDLLARMRFDIRDEVLPRRQLTAVRPDDLVPGLKPGRLGGRIGQYLGDTRQDRGKRPRLTHLVLGDLGRRDRQLQLLGAALDDQVKATLGRGDEGELHLVPLRDLTPVHREDPVADEQARSIRGRSRLDGTYHRRDLAKRRHLDAHHEDDRDEQDRQQHVHDGTSEIDQDPLPAGLVEEFARIVADLPRIFSPQPHVASERNQRNTIVRGAATKSP